MAAISTHLDVKPYQVAVSKDKNLLFRKWNHLAGFFYQPTHMSAAYAAKNYKCEIVRSQIGFGETGIIFEFADGEFVHVGFGS